MKEANTYPAATLADIAAIPVEALPRFLVELPAMLASLREVNEAALAIASDMREKAPWPWSLLPLGFYVAMVRTAGRRSIVWVDDDEGTVTLSARTGQGAAPFYERTEPLS